MTNPKEIATLESQLALIQERLDLLKSAEAMRKSVLSQIDKAIEILNKVDTNQVAAFKAEIDEKFESAEWRSEWDADKLNPTDISPPKTDKSDKKLAAIFGGRVKQRQQFLIIQEELTAIGIKVGKLIKSRENAKGWNLSWNGDKAGLFWNIGDGWCVESLKYDTELTGNWEGFDLEQQLECNGINLDLLDLEDEELLAS